MRQFNNMEFKLLYENAIVDDSLPTIVYMINEDDPNTKFASILDNRILSEIFKSAPPSADEISDPTPYLDDYTIYGPSSIHLDHDNYIPSDILDRFSICICITDPNEFLKVNIIDKHERLINIGMEVNKSSNFKIYRILTSN